MSLWTVCGDILVCQVQSSTGLCVVRSWSVKYWSMCGQILVCQVLVCVWSDPGLSSTGLCVVRSLPMYRAMAVLDPVKVIISDVLEEEQWEVCVPDFPADESRGSHKVPFTRTIFIEKSDFREVMLLSLTFLFALQSFALC